MHQIAFILPRLTPQLTRIRGSRRLIAFRPLYSNRPVSALGMMVNRPREKCEPLSTQMRLFSRLKDDHVERRLALTQLQ